MKNSKIVLLVLVLATLFSCGKDEPANYTTWKCEEISASGSRTYLVNIYKVAKDTNAYLISNFHNISYDADYDVMVKKTNNKLTFITEQIGSSQIYSIKSASGTVNAEFTQMTLDYSIYDGKSEIGFHVVYNR